MRGPLGNWQSYRDGCCSQCKGKMMFFKKAEDDPSQLEKLIAEHRKNQSTNTLHQMLDLFPKVPMYYTSLSPEVGPDTFPYVNLNFRRGNENRTTLKNIAVKALDEGFGVTINKSGDQADWVFSLGDFISLARGGILVSNDWNTGFQSKKIEKDTQVQVGAPNEDIIPLSVRKHLRRFMVETLRFPDPRFYLMFNPQDNPPWTIMFNISRKDFRSEDEYRNVLSYLSWFFPKTVFTGNIENDKNQFYEI